MQNKYGISNIENITKYYSVKKNDIIINKNSSISNIKNDFEDNAEDNAEDNIEDNIIDIIINNTENNKKIKPNNDNNKAIDIIISMISNGYYLTVNELIYLKLVNKNFNNIIHISLLYKSKNFEKKINMASFRILTYYETMSINTIEYNVNLVQRCNICKNLVTNYKILEGVNKILCDKHLKNSFITLTDVINKYKIPKRKILKLSHWKHYKNNNYLFHKKSVKILEIFYKYSQKKFTLFK